MAGSSSARSAKYSRRRMSRDALAAHDDLGAGSCSGLSRTGFSGGGRDARGPRLQRLGAADLAAIGGDGGIVRHVLRLERRDPQAAIGEGAAEAGDDQRLADIGAGAHEHDGARSHSDSGIDDMRIRPHDAANPAAHGGEWLSLGIGGAKQGLAAGSFRRP